MNQALGKTKIIVIGNEKGGAGKSTLAMHIVTALLHTKAQVAIIDLDLRQQSLTHFFQARRVWADSHKLPLPMPNLVSLSDVPSESLTEISQDDAVELCEKALAKAMTQADFVLIDTPGANTSLSRVAHGKADLVVTPLNDSFVDFDMLGITDPVSLDLIRPSLYSETVWEARKQKMLSERRSLDWIVLRNRLASTEARNRKRLEERIEALSKRVGFRVGPGMRDRVIYREL